MKVRNGFVSNSSSTSFALYGAYISNQDIINARDKFGMSEYDATNYYEILEEVLKNTDLGYINPDGEYFVGVGFEQMHEDETKKQFQERIRTQIQEIFDNNTINCSFESGEYYS